MPIAPEIPFNSDLATMDRVKNMGGWSQYQAVGFRDFLNVEILFPFFSSFYLLGIIQVFVSIFAVLGICKGIGEHIPVCFLS